MESLESRIARLTPEQQREVEDFVDFLLLKNTIRQVPVNTPSPAVMLNTPPVMVTDPALPGTHRAVPDTTSGDESDSPAPAADPLPFEEIMSDDDRITSDYFDYGKFEQQPSPATEEVRKVKRKIIARNEQDKGGHLLDWVD